MSVNTLELSTVFQTELDKAFEQQATTTWMDANAGQVIYNGGKTIKIPIINMDGLKDYDRANGYPDGAVELSYIDLGFVVLFGYFTLATYLINEIRSILENCVEMGVNVPNFLIYGLEVASKKVDNLTKTDVGEGE